MSISISIEDYISSAINENNYAAAIARWLHDRVDDSMTIVNTCTDFLQSEQTVDDFMDAHTDIDFTVQLPWFNDTESVLISLEDLLHGLADDDESDLDFESASAVLEDLAGSVAATNSCILAVEDMASGLEFSISDYMAKIEATFGGISDSMLTFTSIVGSIFHNEEVSIKDKLTQCFTALGWIRDDPYPGIGIPDSTIAEYTGLSGIAAAGGMIVGAVQNIGQWFGKVIGTVVAFVDNVVGGALSRVSKKVNDAFAGIITVADAFGTREEYSENYCNNASSYFHYIAAESPVHGTFADKLSRKYMVHFPLGFCAMDLWLSSSGSGGISYDDTLVKLTWRPIDATLLCRLDSARSFTITEWMNGTVSTFDIMRDFRQMFYEMESEEEVRGFLESLADAANSEPIAFNFTEYTGIPYLNFTWDLPIMTGIKAAQLLFFTINGLMYAPGNDAWWNNLETRLAALQINMSWNQIWPNGIKKNITNKGAVLGSLMKSAGNSTFTTLQWGGYDAQPDALCLASLIRDLTQAAAAFNVDPTYPAQNSFVPYFYLGADLTSRYYIYTDADVRSLISNVFKTAAAVFIAVIAWKAISKFKQKMFTARASLDYQVFAEDLAANPSQALALYKKSRALNLISSIGEKICGTVKGAVSGAISTLTSATHALSSLVKGDLSGDNASGETTLKTLKKLIAG